MLAAANSAGGTSTLDTLTAIVILVWAVAGAAAVLGWAGRRMTRWQRQPRSSTVGVAPALLRWLLAKAARDRILGRFVPAPEAPAPGTGWTTGNPEEPDRSAAPVNPAVTREPAQQPETEAREAVPPPANPGARYSPETLEVLGQHLDNARRLAVVEDRLAPLLGALPRDRWLVERYVVIAARRIPFVVIGETGVFAMWALSGQPRWDDLPVLGSVAQEVRNLMPGYNGTVEAGICLPFAPDLEARSWCRPDEPRVWVMGLNSVIPWLQHFGPENGLGVKDIERLNEMGGPRWGRGVTDLPASALVPRIGPVMPG
ncbi:MAG: hypothetical protein JO168_18390 [Solirubrobacterales bacterium]|nr:hypothetical protein [Solirubrobacterales bacterium]